MPNRAEILILHTIYILPKLLTTCLIQFCFITHPNSIISDFSSNKRQASNKRHTFGYPHRNKRLPLSNKHLTSKCGDY